MSDSEPAPRLIQQRFALRRGRTYAVWMILVSLIAAAALAVSLVEGRGEWYQWYGAVGVAVWLGVAVYGVARLRAARRAIREFDDRYGADAGTQG